MEVIPVVPSIAWSAPVDNATDITLDPAEMEVICDVNAVDTSDRAPSD